LLEELGAGRRKLLRITWSPLATFGPERCAQPTQSEIKLKTWNSGLEVGVLPQKERSMVTMPTVSNDFKANATPLLVSRFLELLTALFAKKWIC
jgi:hypothetical protein